MIAPPSLARRLLQLALPPGVRGTTVAADLFEEFDQQVNTRGLLRARFWYWRAAVGVSAVYIRQRRAVSSEQQGASLMDGIAQDARFAVRTLRKSPAFTVAALVTLMVGIGASTAIFTVLNAVVLRPLPYHDPDRLLFLAEAFASGPATISWPNYLDWKRELTSFEGLATAGATTFNLTGDGLAERLIGRAVSWNFLSVLGVKPVLGRDFTPDDDQLGVDHRILISHELWQRRFGGDPAILGRRITLDGETHTVIGVLPAGFRYARPDEIFEPLTPRTGPNSAFAYRGNHNILFAVARLKPGVTEDAARAELTALTATLEKMYPETNGGVGAFVQRLDRRLLGELRPQLLVMSAAVGFLLLIACANVTNLQIARGSARRHELAVRAALGSGRARLARQLIVESLLLAIAGGVLAVGFGAVMLNVLLVLSPPNMPRFNEVRLDQFALLFAAASVLLAGVVFGTLPALHASRRSGQALLVRSGRGGGTAASMRIRRALIVAEMALALILMTGAGLMLRTMQQLAAVDTGFDAHNLATLRFTLSQADWDETRRRLFFDELEARARALPGVSDAALALSLPLEGSNWGSVFILGDRPAPAVRDLPSAAFSPVTPGYFSTLGLRVIEGRVLQPGDRGDGAHAVVVNETFARRFWPGGSAVGQRLKQGFAEWQTPWREIVGVVNDVKLNGIDRDTPLQVYTPLAQDTQRTAAVIARASSDAGAVLLSLTGLIREMNGDLPVYNVRTLEELLALSTALQRVTAAVIAMFAGVALLLAAVGLYGIVAHGVTERVPEIGVRLALGATSWSIVGLFLRHGVITAGIGLVLGATGAYWLTGFLEELLFGVEPVDTIAFAAGAATLFGVALIACYLPATRAAKVSPTAALRGESM